MVFVKTIGCKIDFFEIPEKKILNDQLIFGIIQGVAFHNFR